MTNFWHFEVKMYLVMEQMLAFVASYHLQKKIINSCKQSAYSW